MDIKKALLYSILFGILAYTFLWWRNRKVIIDENPNNEQEPINMIIPLFVILVSFFILLKTSKCGEMFVPQGKIYEVLKY